MTSIKKGGGGGKKIQISFMVEFMTYPKEGNHNLKHPNYLPFFQNFHKGGRGQNKVLIVMNDYVINRVRGSGKV